MKYKVGDKVRIRKDLVPDTYYGGVCYVDYMDGFKGKECIITDMDGISYQMDNFNFWWTDEMLELVDDNEEMLEYALEKLGMTKEELKNEMNRDKEDIERAKEMVRLNNEIDTYCNLFDVDCQGCKVKNFKDKYDDYGNLDCTNVYKYLKEKGEI